MTRDKVPETFEVLLATGATRDLEEIHRYIAETESLARADKVLDQLLVARSSLARFPDRGAYPRELLALGIREYRQIVSAPYRIVYRVADKRVIVFLIADGRRDMALLLARRLLGA